MRKITGALYVAGHPPPTLRRTPAPFRVYIYDDSIRAPSTEKRRFNTVGTVSQILGAPPPHCYRRSMFPDVYTYNYATFELFRARLSWSLPGDAGHAPHNPHLHDRSSYRSLGTVAGVACP